MQHPASFGRGRGPAAAAADRLHGHAHELGVARCEPLLRHADVVLEPGTHRVGAASEGPLDAVYVFGATPHCADCYLAVSAGEGRRHLTDLLWYGVSEYSRRGVPVMNLGGGTSRDDAIAQAKQRFRPERRPMRALRQVYRADAYEELTAAASAPAAEGWFPAYRAPGIS